MGNFPAIIEGFTEIVNIGSGYLGIMSMPETNLAGADVQLVFNSFRAFLMAHQELLNILIGKSWLFSTLPFIGEPMASVLRAVEIIVDVSSLSLVYLGLLFISYYSE